MGDIAFYIDISTQLNIEYTGIGNVNHQLLRWFRRHEPARSRFFLGDIPILAWKGNYDMAFAIATMNLMDVSLLDIPIVTAYQPFDYPFIPTAGKSLQFILYFGLAMSVYPGFFALYTNVERLRNVRALHYSNGVRAGPLWIAYTLFDFMIVLLVAAFAIIICRRAG